MTDGCGAKRCATTSAPSSHAVQRGQRLIGVVQAAQHEAGVAEQHPARVGEGDALADALEQGEPGLALDPLDLERHRRGRKMKPLGDAHERQALGRLREYLRLSDGGVAHGGVSDPFMRCRVETHTFQLDRREPAPPSGATGKRRVREQSAGRQDHRHEGALHLRRPEASADGLLGTGLRAEGDRHPGGVPADAAGRRGPWGGCRRPRWRELDRDLDRPADRQRVLPDQGVSGGAGAGQPGAVVRLPPTTSTCSGKAPSPTSRRRSSATCSASSR